VLGIGGWRALEALGLEPDVCHLNEGHPALAALERVRSIMKSKKQTFETALSTARAGNIFTTHTPVAAGFDRFSPTLVVRYFANYVADLGIPISLLLELGRENSQDAAEAFNMAYLAIRTSGTVNGVSRLHSEVSRRLFQPLFPRWPEVEVPVHYVTNGVHMPSWDSEAADQLWTQACGKGRWLGTLGTIKQDLSRVSDQVFWDFRNQQRSRLIDYARRRMAQQLAFAGSKDSEILRCERMLDRCVLTLGFARRFASYKRPNLLLTDPGRLKRILTDLERPVQIIIAGKAHPEDLVGKALVKEWSEFMLDPSINTRILFIADYDIALALQMVQGVDVWINTPRRPWEACGTSGMKVLVNGGLNLSEMDGWWAEAYAPDSGWAIGDGAEHKDDHEWDAREAEQLYSILENQVIPDFYERDAGGIPCSWIARVRTSMADLTPRFSTNRMLREYVEDLYFPALERFRFRLGENQAAKISEWQHNILECWRNLSIKAVKVESSDGLLTFRIVAFLDGLSPEDVAVQVYAEADGEGEAEIHVARLAGVEHKEKELTYEAEVKTRRPVWHYTVRVIPYFPGVETPLEMNQIFWHDS
jgi:starch phosphorylase